MQRNGWRRNSQLRNERDWAIDAGALLFQLLRVSEPLAIVTVLTIIATVIVSVRGFKDEALREKLIFEPRAILAFREYHRMVSSALLHLDANHLFGNMLTLYFFGRVVELGLGIGAFVIIYLGSIVGGSVLSLWLHRHQEYRALGASGGACGILFATILLWPDAGVMLFFILPMPGWLFAILYLVYSFFGMRHGWGNIGHDAHIGGAMIGLLLAAALRPQAVVANFWLFAVMLALGTLMFLYLWKNPLMLPLKQILPGWHSRPQSSARRSGPTEEEVNAVLEKVTRHGVQSLSAKERRILEQAARR